MTRFQKEQQFLYIIRCSVCKSLGYNIRIYDPFYMILKGMSE